MSEIKEKSTFDELTGRMVVKRSEDVSSTADEVAQIRNATPEHGAYMNQSFVHAGKVPTIIIEQMMQGQCCTDGNRYNLLSPDPEEQRRALLHLQSCHKEWLTIRGRPFAKNRVIWS